mmetsp:Transcript_29580/g.71190  ORF Transcript_29580/g.71190 Transcript_29580/m.71190 type:complete len:234 (+) Transcript_29580:484-1185(+)
MRVSRQNVSWWLTSFLLAAGLCSLAVVGNLGILSHKVAQAEDDKDGVRDELFATTRQMGRYSVGLLLIYVFKVEISPYGKPIEHWPSIPASTKIYILGLVYILLQTMVAHMASIVFPARLVRNGYVGRVARAYDPSKFQLEGKVKEEDMPLLEKAFKPEADDGAESESAPEIATTRKYREKTYHVMSAEEAVMINRYVKLLYIVKIAMIVFVTIAACVILIDASIQVQNMIDS